MGDGGDLGGVLIASRGRFCGHRSWLQFRDEPVGIWLQFCFQVAAISATIGPRSRHNRAAIGPRSWSAPFVDRLLIDWIRLPNKRSAFAARSRLDWTAIESSSTCCLRRPMMLPLDERSRLIWSSAPRSWGESTASRPMKPWSNCDGAPSYLMPPRVIR